MTSKNILHTGSARSGCSLIAEIGTSHAGSKSRAADLIRAAADSGADWVKFQHFYAKEILHPLTGNVLLPGGSVPLYERFKELEQPVTFFEYCKNEAEKCSVGFLCTPFGPQSCQELLDLGVSPLKIASPELNYTQLLRQASRVPLVVSTGVSRLEDIEYALEQITSEVMLLHCITAYPAPPQEYNLGLIQTLKAVFGVSTGVSDHSTDPRIVPACAAALGAAAVEKHFTLKTTDGGLDDPIALTPEDLRKTADAVQKFAGVYEEQGAEIAIDQLKGVFGSEQIAVYLGDGVKRLAPSEAANYGRTNRSLHALHALQPGDVLTEKDFAPLRTEKELRPGLHPKFSEIITGKRVSLPIPAGEGIRWQDLLRD